MRCQRWHTLEYVAENADLFTGVACGGRTESPTEASPHG